MIIRKLSLYFCEKFSQFHKDKTFNYITRQNIISFLDRLRNPETDLVYDKPDLVLIHFVIIY